MNHSNEIWKPLYLLLIFLLYSRVVVQENMFVETGIHALPLLSLPLLPLAPMPPAPSLFLLKACIFWDWASLPSAALLLMMVSWIQTPVKSELAEFASCLYALWSGLRTCRPSPFVFSLHLFHPAAAKGFYVCFQGNQLWTDLKCRKTSAGTDADFETPSIWKILFRKMNIKWQI